jgi:hypothetical protein
MTYLQLCPEPLNGHWVQSFLFDDEEIHLEEQEMELQIRALLSSEYRESIKMGNEDPDEEEEGL